MEATWAATKTVAYDLVVRQIKESVTSDSLSSTVSKVNGKKGDGTVSATSSGTKGLKTTSLVKQADTWVNNNPTTIIFACVLGISGLILGVLGLWCYLRLRDHKQKLVMENLEVEAGRMAIEEKERARMEAESGDGAYPHFGASSAPLKQQTTFGDNPYDEGYGEDKGVHGHGANRDVPDSYKLDDIPDELDHRVHKGHQPQRQTYGTNDDEEEGLRDSQMQGSNDGQEDQSLTSPRARRAPRPSPASNMSDLRADSYDEDPRLTRPQLRRMNQHSDTVDTMDTTDSDARDSVYSIDDRTKYA